MASVSVERFFLFYFLLNFCLLYLTRFIVACDVTKWRLLSGAAALAAYLTAEYIASVSVWQSFAGRVIVSLGVISWTFSGSGVGGVSRIFLFVNMLALLVSGIFFSFAARLTPLTAFMGIVAVSLLLLGVFLPTYRQPKRQGGICRVRLEMAGHDVTLNGLLDSGNLLYTPLGLLPVMVADYQAVMPLFGNAVREFLSSIPPKSWLSSLDSCPDEGWRNRLTLIETASVGGRKMLLSFKPDKIMVIYGDGSQRIFKGAVALTDGMGHGDYDALLHRDFLK